MRSLLTSDILKGNYEPFVSLPRSVVILIVDQLSDSDVVRLALVSKSTRGHLLADACLCQDRLHYYTEAVRRFEKYERLIKSIDDVTDELDALSKVDEEVPSNEDEMQRLRDKLDQLQRKVDIDRLKTPLRWLRKFFVNCHSEKMYFWYRHQYCPLFNRCVRAIRIARDMPSLKDILPEGLVSLALRIDWARGRKADWDFFEPDVTIFA